jgi:hypothetical protein
VSAADVLLLDGCFEARARIQVRCKCRWRGAEYRWPILHANTIEDRTKWDRIQHFCVDTDENVLASGRAVVVASWRWKCRTCGQIQWTDSLEALLLQARRHMESGDERCSIIPTADRHEGVSV